LFNNKKKENIFDGLELFVPKFVFDIAAAKNASAVS